MADSTQPGEQDNGDADRKQKARERNRRYRERHPDAGRQYYLDNRERILKKCSEYRQNHIEQKKHSDRLYYLRNKEKISANAKLPRGRAIQKTYREKNKDTLRKRHKEWRDNNREHLRSYKRLRRESNPHLVLINRMRCRTWGALRNGMLRKAGKTLDLIGCTAVELVAWIESQFSEGMCWSRIAEIHIDHVIPLAAFNLDDQDQQQAAFHYTNLRPMWALENKRKSDRIPGQRLFGFAYADRIAEGIEKKPRRKRRKSGRQHIDH